MRGVVMVLAVVVTACSGGGGGNTGGGSGGGGGGNVPATTVDAVAGNANPYGSIIPVTADYTYGLSEERTFTTQ